MKYRVEIEFKETIERKQVYYVDTDSKGDRIVTSALILGELVSDEELDCLSSDIIKARYEEVPVGN